jgi:hypothetical protein
VKEAHRKTGDFSTADDLLKDWSLVSSKRIIVIFCVSWKSILSCCCSSGNVVVLSSGTATEEELTLLDGERVSASRKFNANKAIESALLLLLFMD